MEKMERSEELVNAGERIRKLREYLGMSRGEFAARIGYSNSHIGRLENGTGKVREEMINSICETFHVDRDYFSTIEETDAGKWIRCENHDGLTVSERLKQERENRNYSQLYLSEISETSQSLISNVESGKYALFPKQAEKLAEALEIGSEYLMTGNLDKKDYPVNNTMISWLWNHPEERKIIWEKIKGEELERP